tara:strand:+ start:4312 stop:5301 length:990 start_codon:yes stop_codon:yes gene_type:complete
VIVKYFEIKKINIKLNKIILLYGKNDGLKDEATNFLIKKDTVVSVYEESNILDSPESFIESLKSKSLFEEKKTIIIKRASDKILKVIEELSEEKIDDILIINSENLEKKSKLRIFFEKHKSYSCVAFYPDNNETLLKLANNFFQKRKILISNENLNQIVNKTSGSRKNLIDELEKIDLFCANRKKIDSEHINKLINLAEDHNISELIDYCLAKNEKKILSILNENNFNNEDCILITRIFLNKAKRILKLSSDYSKNNNIDLTISSAKPPIFWKDKEITKQQIYKWTPKNIKKLIFKINDLELIIKKNVNSSVNIILDFILEQTTSITNN